MTEQGGIHSEQLGHIKTLTGLRGFAALWVFMLHSCFGATIIDPAFPAFDHLVHWGPLEGFVSHGHFAVDLFFILSGFVMSHVYHRDFIVRPDMEAVKFFLVKRLARIYPVHALMTILIAVLTWTALYKTDVRADASNMALSLMMANVWGDLSINPPSWSVSAEWFAYLACPLLVWLAWRLRHKGVSIAVIVFLSLLFPFCYQFFLCCNWISGWVAIFRVITGFGIGCILYNMYRVAPAPAEGYGNDIACFGFFAALAMALKMGLPPYMVYPLLPWLIYHLARSRGFMAAIFANKGAVFLGLISYSIYMCHHMVDVFYAWLFGHFFPEGGAGVGQPVLWAYLAMMTAGLLACSTMLYLLVEVPCRQRIMRWYSQYSHKHSVREKT